MGQQQILPLVLATIIIGVAIIRGMAMFDQERKGDRHKDEVRQYMLSVAGRSQAWYRQPAGMGGGGRSFAQVSWKNINAGANTPIANFTMSSKQQNRFLLTGISKEDPSIIIKYMVYPDSVLAVP